MSDNPAVRQVLPGKPRSRVATFFRALRLLTHPGSHVRTTGQLRSFRENRCIDGDGYALPWLNYPLIHVLRERLQADIRLFEYGCGYSTLFFARHVEQLVAVDHVQEWADLVNQQLPSTNHQVLSFSDKQAYIEALPADQDFILVDGIHRPAALAYATQQVSNRGVILLDDSQRADYQPAIEATVAQGFKQLTFVGPRPQSLSEGYTTIFYREGNCLGLEGCAAPAPDAKGLSLALKCDDWFADPHHHQQSHRTPYP